MEIWSFFSGALGLDLGMEMAGLPATLAVERDPLCRQLIAANRPEVQQVEGGDITAVTGESLRLTRGYSGDVFLLVGGPPCQSFSPGGNRAALSDPRGNLIYHYMRLIGEVRPEYFILENVGNLITAALRHRPIKDRPGEHWSLKRYSGGRAPVEEGKNALAPDEQSGSAIRQMLADLRGLGYNLNFGVLNSAEHGAPQRRYRFIILGSRDTEAPSLPSVTHGERKGLRPFATVRDAIWDLQDNPGAHSSYTEEMARFFRLIPPGGNWRDLPANLQRAALGNAFESGGGKTGFFRRLDWNEPAPTITGKANRKGSAVCHPATIRPLSVRESARLQGFPDNWTFVGSMSSQYLQVGNAVPVHLGVAVGRALVRHVESGSSADRIDWDAQLAGAVRILRASARNKRSRVDERPTSAQNAFAFAMPE